MTKVIIASVIMASVTYGKCYLWQRYYGNFNYGKWNYAIFDAFSSDLPVEQGHVRFFFIYLKIDHF